MVSSPASRNDMAGADLPAPANVAVIPAEPRSKGRILAYIAIPLVIVALGVWALYYTTLPVATRPAINSCVKQNGAAAVKVVCSAPGAFEVVKSVTNSAQCPDYLNEPSIAYTVGGKTTIYCLQQPAK
jgi:hypothetical protein